MSDKFRYKILAGDIERKIMDGTYHPGEKLPSIRRLHLQSNLSISTVYRAYMELETSGLIETRPKSGYYVSPIRLQELKAPVKTRTASTPRKVNLSSMINSVVSAINNPVLLPLGSTVIDTELLPFKRLARILKELSHQELKSLMSYTLSDGYPELRRKLALRTVGISGEISPEDIIITNGCMEAVALALMAVTRPGDTIAIEAPTNFSFLQLLKELGVLVMEVPADSRYGLDIDILENRLRVNPIKACLFMPNFHNPLGALMPEANKERLVRLMNAHGIPIIEDDISSELYFEGQRPTPLKAFDRRDLVLTCSSFSKTLAPGFRIGWIIPGKRFKEKVQTLKGGTSISTSALDQHLISRYLDGGAYERHLRSLRNSLKKQMLRTALSIQKHFPPGTRLAVPAGGSILWIQLHPEIDALEIYRRALARNISIIPGQVCSNSGQFRNCIQISCGLPFSPLLERGIATLGELIASKTPV
jgi:DNA-binding transcriptional MocR family regulator